MSQIKTPEQIAEATIANNYADEVNTGRDVLDVLLTIRVLSGDDVRRLIVAAIEADRAQRTHEDAMRKRREVDTALTIAERIMEPMQFAVDGYATGDSAYFEYIEERIIAAAGEGIRAGRTQRGIIEQIAECLDGRGATAAAALVRDTDPDDDLWNNYIGPMIDSIQEDYTASAAEIQREASA